MGYQTNMHMNHITALNVLILIAFGGLVSHNQNLERFRLRAFMQTIIVLFLCAVSAWAGVSLKGRHPEFRWLHIMMKLIELIAVPAVPVLIGQTVTYTMNRIALAAAGLHAVLEVVLVSTGWIFHVDGQSVYHRGAFFWLYVVFCLAGAVYMFLRIFRQIRVYQNQNLLSMMLLIAFLAYAMTVQVLFPEAYLIWLTCTVLVVLYYGYFIDMTFRIDRLTGLLNRQDDQSAMRTAKYPLSLVIIDVNDFKHVNDHYGHAYGDQCLKIVAVAILKLFRKNGRCFRIGGDEFSVLFSGTKKEAEICAENMMEIMKHYKEKDIKIPHVSYGIAEMNHADDYKESFALADQRMYAYKEHFKAEHPKTEHPE